LREVAEFIGRHGLGDEFDLEANGMGRAAHRAEGDGCIVSIEDAPDGGASGPDTCRQGADGEIVFLHFLEDRRSEGALELQLG